MSKRQIFDRIVQAIAPDAPSRTYVCPYTIRLDAALHCLQGHRIHWGHGGECDGKPLGSMCIGNGEVECRFPRLGYAEHIIAQRLIAWMIRAALKMGWL